MSDISKTGIKVADQISWLNPEPFYLDLPQQLTLDLPQKKPHITSDFVREIPQFKKYATKEDSFFTPKKVREIPSHVIVENQLVPNSPKWNRYYKYQEAIKHHRKLTREQIIDWTKMWVEVHPKEARASKLKNYQEKLKVQETNRKLDCMIDGVGNAIQEVRHQDRKIQELNVRMRSESVLRRIQESKQPTSNLWHAETKH